jgi:hypothetical protein
MDQLVNSQELARRFNKDEAVWRAYEIRRRLRLLHGVESPVPDGILNELDWIAAESEYQQTWCVGKIAPDGVHSSEENPE